MTYFFSGILPSLEMYLAGKKHLVFLVVKRKGRVWKNLLVLSDMKTQNVCDGFRRWSWTSRFNVTSLEMINGRIQVGVAVASRPTSWLERVLPQVSCISCVAFGKLLIKLTFSVSFLKKKSSIICTDIMFIDPSETFPDLLHRYWNRLIDKCIHLLLLMFLNHVTYIVFWLRPVYWQHKDTESCLWSLWVLQLPPTVQTHDY